MFETGPIRGVTFTHRQNFCVGGSALFIDNREVIIKSDFRVV